MLSFCIEEISFNEYKDFFVKFQMITNNNTRFANYAYNHSVFYKLADQNLVLYGSAEEVKFIKDLLHTEMSSIKKTNQIK